MMVQGRFLPSLFGYKKVTLWSKSTLGYTLVTSILGVFSNTRQYFLANKNGRKPFISGICGHFSGLA